MHPVWERDEARALLTRQQTGAREPPLIFFVKENRGQVLHKLLADNAYKLLMRQDRIFLVRACLGGSG
jgi:hypothetical protein